MGRLYGSLHNRLMEDCNGQPVLAVGLGATECHYSDRDAYTIIEVAANGKSFKMQEDKSFRTDLNPDGSAPMGDNQHYRYEPNPEGAIREVAMNRKGKWRVVSSVWSDKKFKEKGDGWYRSLVGGNGVIVGCRDKHYDYSF